MRRIILTALLLSATASLADDKPKITEAELSRLKSDFYFAYSECHGFYQDKGYYAYAACTDLSVARSALNQHGYCIKEDGDYPTIHPCGEERK